MKRRWVTRGLLVTSCLSLAGLIAAFASCATNEGSDANQGDAATLPETSTPVTEADAGVDAPSDGGCDAADPSCTTHVVSCDDVEWCGVATNVSAFHSLTAVWGSGPNDVWASGSGGTIAHYDGTAWKDTPTGLKNTFFAIWGSGPNDVWAVSDARAVLHSTGFANGTTTWTAVPTPVQEAAAAFLTSIWGSGPNDIRLGGRAYNYGSSYDPYNTFIKVSPDAGVMGQDDDAGAVSWSPISGSGSVLGIWGSSANDVWMVADNSVYVNYQRGQTLHGRPADGGVEAGADPLVWTDVDSQANVVLRSVWGSSASDVWAVGDIGTIRHITPTDTRWQKVESPTGMRLNRVWGSGPNDIWMVGESGTILHYDGTNFRNATAQFPLGRKPDLMGVWGSGPNDVWIVGDGIALHYTGPKAQGGTK